MQITIKYVNIARHQRERHGLETRQGVRVTIPEEFKQEVRITRARQGQGVSAYQLRQGNLLQKGVFIIRSRI